MDDPLNGAQLKSECDLNSLNKASLILQMGYGLISEWGPSGKYHMICDVMDLKAFVMWLARRREDTKVGGRGGPKRLETNSA